MDNLIPYFDVVPLPVAPHDDLMAAYLSDDPTEFDRLHALYYPEGEDL